MNHASLFLTDIELNELTGYKVPAYQARWLRENGFTFRLSANNRVQVARDHFLVTMGAVKIPVRAAKTTPDFSTLPKVA